MLWNHSSSFFSLCFVLGAQADSAPHPELVFLVPSCIPPDPSGVIESALQKYPLRSVSMQAVGYGLFPVVFSAYLPAVIGITCISNLDNLAAVPLTRTQLISGTLCSARCHSNRSSVSCPHVWASFSPCVSCLTPKLAAAPRPESVFLVSSCLRAARGNLGLLDHAWCNSLLPQFPSIIAASIFPTG